MGSAAFTRMASVTASTKRAALSSGKSAGFTAYLTGVKCLPLMPVDAETRNRPELQTSHEVKDTYVDSGLDIVEGDSLTISSVDYPVRAAEEWIWQGAHYLRVIVEELKR